ncbi:MAG: hypothetical protein IRY99_17490 [Isosphaeraceae bacterium]|nr:hypothetical protein [Isosphaeraceae bacterium]
MTNFKKELQAAGYKGTTEQFFAAVAQLFATARPGQTDEQLKRHPQDAIRFCDEVRAHFGLVSLDDAVILGAFENNRKHRSRLAKTH